MLEPEPPRRRKKKPASPTKKRKRKKSRVDSETLAIAQYQRVLLLCIPTSFLMLLVVGAVPDSMENLALILLIGVVLTGSICSFMLATKVYNFVAAVFFFVISIIPLAGLIAMLIVNQKATGLLQSRGIRVGLLGANLS